MGLILKKRIRQAMDPKDILVSQLILALCIVLVALNVAFFVFFPRLMAPVSIVLSNAITLLLTAIAFRPASTLIQKTLARRQEELLAQAEKERQDAAVSAQRRAQVGTGMRNERIRTYNFPQGRVTDHRIGLTLYRLDAVMNGDLDELIDALLTAWRAEQLRSAGEGGES